MLATAAIALLPAAGFAQSNADVNADTSVTAEGSVILPTDQAENTDPAMTEEGAGKTMSAEGAEEMMPSEDAEATDTADAAGESNEMQMGSDNIADAADNVNGEMPDEMGMASGDAGILGITGEFTANDLIGNRVFSTTEEGADWDMSASFDAVDAEWERIGSIHNIVMSADGQLEGIVAEVGGFLGIGDKFVLLTGEDAKLVPNEGAYDLVTSYTSDELTDLPEYEEGTMY
jgi:hypothetical protein